jgi:hypothetical protein
MSSCVNARRVCVRTFPRAPLLNPSAVTEISSGASTTATMSYSPSVQNTSFTDAPPLLFAIGSLQSQPRAESGQVNDCDRRLAVSGHLQRPYNMSVMTTQAAKGRARDHLADVSPRVFLLDRLIRNFLECILICVFFILLFLLFCGYLLVAFLPELATTALAVPHLRVGRHHQDRNYRSYCKGSHFDHQK